MHERSLRHQYAELLRHFVVGLLTNEEFVEREEGILGRFDRAEQQDLEVVAAVTAQAWFRYDDIRTHKLTGKWALMPQTRREVARWIVFLYCGQKYDWPYVPREGCLLNLLTLGVWWRRKERQLRLIGDWDLWPFMNRADYEEALRTPRLLAGLGR